MMTIEDNSKYSLVVEKFKNRAFLKIKGFWRNREEVSEYLSDWDKSLAHLNKGFTLLTDARDMKIHPAEVREIHREAQLKIEEAGVKKVAELQSESVAEMQLDGVSRESGIYKKNFKDEDTAIQWLDE
jgi:hypothetical protein